MVAKRRGKIINFASLLTFQGGITVPAYAAAKGLPFHPYPSRLGGSKASTLTHVYFFAPDLRRAWSIDEGTFQRMGKA